MIEQGQNEPILLPVTNEQLPAGSKVTYGVRADIGSLGFWNPLSQAFFDIRVVNPLTETNLKKDSSCMYKDHEKAKKTRQVYNGRQIYLSNIKKNFGQK